MRAHLVAPRSRRVAGWVVIGVSASLLELRLLHLLYEFVGWPLPVASVVAAEVLILGKFFLSDRWVFGHRWPAVNRLVRYQGASIGAVVVYLLAFNGLVGLLGLPYDLAFWLGTGAAFIWSLLTNFLWVWAAK